MKRKRLQLDSVTMAIKIVAIFIRLICSVINRRSCDEEEKVPSESEAGGGLRGTKEERKV